MTSLGTPQEIIDEEREFNPPAPKDDFLGCLGSFIWLVVFIVMIIFLV